MVEFLRLKTGRLVLLALPLAAGLMVSALPARGSGQAQGGIEGQASCVMNVQLRRPDLPAAALRAPAGAAVTEATARFAVTTGVTAAPRAEVALFTAAVDSDDAPSADPAGRLAAVARLMSDVPQAIWSAAVADVAPGRERPATELFRAPDGPWRLSVPLTATTGGPPVQVPQAFMLVRPMPDWPFDRVLLHGAATLRDGLRPRPGLLPEATVEVVDGPRAVVVAGRFARPDGVYFRATLPEASEPTEGQRAKVVSAIAHALGDCVQAG